MESTIHVNLIQHVSLHVGALKFFGIWFYIPYSMKSFKFWIVILYRIVAIIFVFIIPPGAQLIYVVKLILSGNAEIQEIAEIVSLAVTELLVILKLLDLSLRRNILTQLMDQLISNEVFCYTYAQKEILESAIKMSRRLFIFTTCYGAVDLSVQVILVPSLQSFQILPLKMDFIYFDVHDEAYFRYVYAYQIIYKPMMLVTFSTLQTLAWAGMLCSISQLDVLIHNFENMKELVEDISLKQKCDENKAYKEILKRCIRQHQYIIRFTDKLQATFCGQLTATLVLSTIVICTTAVQILSIESPSENITVLIWVFMYFIIILMIFFIDCYYGNAITDKSMHVATAAYSCPWINMSTDIKKKIIIVIARAQKPLVISTVILVPVSIETFTKVMNWTYKIFAVMNQMNK